MSGTQVLPGALTIGCGFDGVTGQPLAASIYQTTYPPLTSNTPYPGQGSYLGGVWTPSGATFGFMIPYDIDLTVVSDPPFTGTAATYQSSSSLTQAVGASLGVSASYGEFSGSVQGIFAQQTAQNDSNYYAFIYTRTYLCTIALPTSFYGGQPFSPDGYTTMNASFITAVAGLPAPFAVSDMPLFSAFFATWGTHVLVGGILGSSFMLASAVQRSSNVDTETATAAITAQCNGILSGKATASASYKSDYASYIGSSQVNVDIYGGTNDAANTLFEYATGYGLVTQKGENTSYSDWVNTCTANPLFCAYQVVNIWEAAQAAGATNAQVAALQSAYFAYIAPYSCIPVYEYQYNFGGDVSGMSYQYTTFEFPETFTAPDGASFGSPTVPFYTLPFNSPFLSPPPDSLLITSWPFEAQTITRMYTTSNGNAQQAWIYTYMPGDTDPNLVEAQEKGADIFGPYAPNGTMTSPAPDFVPIYRFDWQPYTSTGVNGIMLSTDDSGQGQMTLAYATSPLFYAVVTSPLDDQAVAKGTFGRNGRATTLGGG